MRKTCLRYQNYLPHLQLYVIRLYGADIAFKEDRPTMPLQSQLQTVPEERKNGIKTIWLELKEWLTKHSLRAVKTIQLLTYWFQIVAIMRLHRNCSVNLRIVNNKEQIVVQAKITIFNLLTIKSGGKDSGFSRSH